MGREVVGQKSVEEVAIYLYNHLLNNKYLDVISAGSAALEENGDKVITVWIGSISEKEKEVLPKEQGGYQILYTFYDPPSFF